MSWLASILAVQKNGNQLIPIAPKHYQFDDERWQVWGSYDPHMKNLVRTSACATFTKTAPYFENRGRFYGKLLPFLDQNIADSMAAMLPAEIRDYLDENIGEGRGFFIPASLRDLVEFDYDQFIGSLDLDGTGIQSEITFRQYIDRYDNGAFFRTIDWLKQYGHPEDIYLLAWWA